MHHPAKTVAAVTFAAFAVSPVASANALSEALFQKGKVLVEEGHLEQGCSKLAQSQRLDPSPGTLWHLADCEERRGKTATAWALFLDAGTLARSRNRADVVELAQRRADALEPKLSWLKVTPHSPEKGLVVQRNGTPFEAGTLNTDIPVDPGEYRIFAEAPGRAPWSTSVRVEGNGARVVVTIPPLEPVASTPPGSPLRVVGYAIGAAGLVGLGLGVAFHFVREGKLDDRDAACPGAPRIPCASDEKRATFLAHQNGAQTAATTSLVATVAGGAFVAAGIVLFLVEPASSGPSTDVALFAGAGQGGLVTRSTW